MQEVKKISDYAELLKKAEISCQIVNGGDNDESATLKVILHDCNMTVIKKALKIGTDAGYPIKFTGANFVWMHNPNWPAIKAKRQEFKNNEQTIVKNLEKLTPSRKKVVIDSILKKLSDDILLNELKRRLRKSKK